ncbi:hypothetical protein [Bradyrhizobium iriomotense]|uniref:Uncharacterized protein n=1 Tax=Bradyrhizobium iriomotense TaxID=441950 RepID=A0ABQ6AWL2_9BRAD|nr:hypothetical protein [Bradyrhizobium iriomotense]GLR86533.1 hypothetical protein GCM10007857_32440 [Bradyrhizobium iriomotense]
MSSQPHFIAYSVKERDGKAIWTKIGAGFLHQKSGCTIQLDALPLGDRIVLLEPKDDKAGSTAAGNGGAP